MFGLILLINSYFTCRLFDNFIMELQTIANQYLKPERIMEYLDILKKRDSGDYEKSATFFKYVLVTRYEEKDKSTIVCTVSI